MPRPTLTLMAAGILAASLSAVWPYEAEGAAAGNATISVSGFAFQPEVVRILAGDSVTWRVGDDPEQHTVTPLRAGAFRDSGALFSGQTYRLTFPRPGTFPYFCRFHPFMEGSVVVGTTGRSPAGSSRPGPAESTLERQPAATPETPAPTAPGPPRGTPTATTTAPSETSPDSRGAGGASSEALLLGAAVLLLAGGAVLLSARRRRG
jgi:plastocyanin